MRKEKGACYICGKTATTTEHVPPKCFFPEKKDIGDVKDYRQQLITIPSCNEHNLKKSKDDEYAWFIIVSHFQNVSVAQTHSNTKIARAMLRNPILENLYKPHVPASVDGMATIATIVDGKRFFNAMDHISRGVYYHHFNTIYSGTLNILVPSFVYMDDPDCQGKNEQMNQWEATSSEVLQDYPIYGANPEIFHYQVVQSSQTQITALRLVFYSGFIVDVCMNGS
ncbi:hypothetical protein HOD41_02945 [bacterium]|jgi:hypothetical protein|nr:hypothetical protein [bacterium]